MFSHLHFADSISHSIRCTFSHFRIFALRTLYVSINEQKYLGVQFTADLKHRDYANLRTQQLVKFWALT